ncbi:MAG: virulence factor SrfB [Lentisphaeria bacterium]|jgi:hypothetical protein
MQAISLSCDSGHHFFFLPMSFNRKDLEPPEVRARVFAEDDPDWDEQWLQVVDADFHTRLREVLIGANDDCRWKTWPGKTWIRYRYGSKRRRGREGDAIGLWLALETNLGDASRGLPVDARPPQPRDQEAFRRHRDRQPATAAPPPYFAATPHDLPSHPLTLGLKARLEEDGFVIKTECPDLEILWPAPFGGEPVPVDLIIDLGNTRTVVLALEQRITNATGLNQVCRPIDFRDELDGLFGARSPGNGIVDSSFALRTTPFHGLEDSLNMLLYDTEQTKTGFWPFQKEAIVLRQVREVAPHMFVHQSPAILGEAMRRAMNDPQNQRMIASGGNFFQSSPKRYYWDNDPMGRDGHAYWNMFPNRTATTPDYRLGNPPLAGSVFRFLPIDGKDWSLDNPPNTWPEVSRPATQAKQAQYPRSDTLTWMALSILETAHRQINAAEWKQDDMKFIPRYLRTVSLTYPGGWTEDEKKAFTGKWQKALNIFIMTHLRQDDQRPTLELAVDEAVASQLTYVYSEIRNLNHKADDWLRLVGRTDSSGKPKCRVITLDIGGGTADLSIVEYENQSSSIVRLASTLLFKDSATVAGDTLVRHIIAEVLLPALLPASQENKTEFLRERFTSTSAAEVSVRQLVIAQVLIPIVHHWLACLGSGIDNPLLNPEHSQGGRCYSPKDIGIDERNWDQLAELLGIQLRYDNPIPVTVAALNACVNDVFSGQGFDFLQSLAKFIASYDVDVAVVCGKTSEIPHLRTLIHRILPLRSDRIVFLKDYQPGDWYPVDFLANGRIRDAKTTTATGAALGRALRSGLVNKGGWQLLPTAKSEFFTCRNYWLQIAPDGAPGEIFLTPEETEKTLRDVAIHVRIGRSMLKTARRPELVYRLRWRPEHPLAKDPDAALCNLDQVTLRREIVPGDASEKLVLVKALGSFKGATLTADDLELMLCPLTTEDNWQENGKLFP